LYASRNGSLISEWKEVIPIDKQAKKKIYKTRNASAAKYRLLQKKEKNKIRRIVRHIQNMRRGGHVDRAAEYNLALHGGQKLLLEIRDLYSVLL